MRFAVRPDLRSNLCRRLGLTRSRVLPGEPLGGTVLATAALPDQLVVHLGRRHFESDVTGRVHILDARHDAPEMAEGVVELDVPVAPEGRFTCGFHPEGGSIDSLGPALIAPGNANGAVVGAAPHTKGLFAFRSA